MKKTKISYFKNVQDTKPKTIYLEDWLSKTIKPPKELEKQVLKFRNLRSKRLKLKIPCVTISASFKKVRNLDNIKQKTNLICIDIDLDSNPVANMELVKSLFTSHPSTLYVGYSVSNNGIYAIIRISKGKVLIKYFKHFKKNLKRLGVIIDESCKDYTRLRFFSYDSEAYYNPKAKPFKLPKKRKLKPSKKTGNASRTDTEKVEAIINLIEMNAIDITSNYEDWYKIAGALNEAFGESGRDYFHRISKYHHDYSIKKTDNKYNNCRNMNRVTLSSFFHVASEHGIRY